MTSIYFIYKTSIEKLETLKCGINFSDILDRDKIKTILNLENNDRVILNTLLPLILNGCKWIIPLYK